MREYLIGAEPGAYRRIDRIRMLQALPVGIEGWPHQCRCGTMKIVRYRGRYYCQVCGNRKRACPGKITGRSCDCPLPATYKRT